MNDKKTFKLGELFPIKEIKEDLNLIYFNSPDFTTDEMKRNNLIMEALANVKIDLNLN